MSTGSFKLSIWKASQKKNYCKYYRRNKYSSSSKICRRKYESPKNRLDDFSEGWRGSGGGAPCYLDEGVVRLS